ncbi:Major facilitator family transporter [Francisella tularensis subsp. novicida PA10-7858]|nr:Major facilitator family transporter [Francisella tularensis subsp. novicida PA10-7858]
MYTRMINTSLSAFSIPLINQYGFSSIDIAFAISIYRNANDENTCWSYS